MTSFQRTVSCIFPLHTKPFLHLILITSLMTSIHFFLFLPLLRISSTITSPNFLTTLSLSRFFTCHKPSQTTLNHIPDYVRCSNIFSCITYTFLILFNPTPHEWHQVYHFSFCNIFSIVLPVQYKIKQQKHPVIFI